MVHVRRAICRQHRRQIRSTKRRRQQRAADRRGSVQGQYFSGRHRPGSVSRSSPPSALQPPSPLPRQSLRPRQYLPTSPILLLLSQSVPLLPNTSCCPPPTNRSSSRRHLHYSPSGTWSRAVACAAESLSLMPCAVLVIRRTSLSLSRSHTRPVAVGKGTRARSFSSLLCTHRNSQGSLTTVVCARLSPFSWFCQFYFTPGGVTAKRVSLYTGRNRAVPHRVPPCAALSCCIRFDRHRVVWCVQPVSPCTDSCVVLIVNDDDNNNNNNNNNNDDNDINNSRYTRWREGRASRAWIKKEDILQSVFFAFAARDRCRLCCCDIRDVCRVSRDGLPTLPTSMYRR